MVRELLSSSIIPFTFDFPCSIEGLQAVRQNICGFHRSVSLSCRKEILGVVSHSHLLPIFFISTKAQNDLAVEHQLGRES